MQSRKERILKPRGQIRSGERFFSVLLMAVLLTGSLICLLNSLVSSSFAANVADERLFQSFPSPSNANEYALLLSEFHDPSFTPAAGGNFVDPDRGDQVSLHDLATFNLSSQGVVGPLGLERSEIKTAAPAPSQKKSFTKKSVSAPVVREDLAKILALPEISTGFFRRLSTAQSISEIAATHNIDPKTLARHNNVDEQTRFRKGALVFVPSSAQPVGTTVKASTPFLIPAPGRFTSGFGDRELFGSRNHHDGIDIANRRGTVIVAAAEGRVTLSEWYGGYGRCVKIEHAPGVETLYAHCTRLLVREGDRVKAGQPIALMGSTGRSTGSHVHFEIRLSGTAVNPLRYLDVRSGDASVHKQIAANNP